MNKDNTPAFPTIEQNVDDTWSTVPGATLLDYMAAKAMQGSMTYYRPIGLKNYIKRLLGLSYKTAGHDFDKAADNAYKAAAAMIEARKKY